MTVYYIKNSIVFRKDTTKIKYFDLTNLTNINSTSINSNKNKEIIEILENIETNTKQIKLSSPIDNFNEFQLNLEETYKDNKSQFHKIEDDDYDSLEITSTIDIINALTKNIESQNTENIEEYIKKAKEFENKEKKLDEEQIEFLKNKIDYVEKEKQDFIDNNMKNELDQINEKTKIMGDCVEKQRKLQKEIDEIENKEKSPEIIKIENKKEEFQNQLNEIIFQIKILEQKITVLDRKKKLGVKKSPNPYLMILTLGLIYWSKISDIRYNINKISILIEKKKEKAIKLEEKVKNKDLEIEKWNQKHKDEQINNAKSIQKKQEQIDKLEIEINQITKETDKIRKSLKPYEKHIGEYNKKKFNIELEIQKIIFNIAENQKNNSETIKHRYELIINKQKDYLEQLYEIKNKIEKQKTKIKNDFKVSI